MRFLGADSPSEERSLLALLLRASRQGFRFLHLEGEKLIHQLHLLGIGEPEREAQELLERIPSLSPHFIGHPSAEFPTAPLILHEGALYLHRHFVAESESWEAIEAHLQAATEPLSLSSEEKSPAFCSAWNTLSTSPLLLVTGGPGSGKSTLASQLLHACKRERPMWRVALAAPTGRAAHRLHSLIGPEADLHPTTLHHLLGWGRGTAYRSSPTPLSADLILIDEASMIDAEMMAELLKRLKPGARLLLFGDANQLPSVEAGELFREMIDSPRLQSYCLTLTHNHRVHSRDLQALAKACLEGKEEEVTHLLQRGEGIRWVPSLENVYPLLQECWQPYLAPYSLKDPRPALEGREAFVLLTSHRKGALGADLLNRQFSGWHRREAHPYWIPILITANAFELGLVNGESALLSTRSREVALLDGDQIRFLPLDLLPSYELGYALTVHKAQGGECERVALLVQETGEGITPELLYTGITRAKRELILFGEGKGALCFAPQLKR